MKQTAVEWLKVTVKSMIENGEDADLYAVLWHIEQAKEMEKGQAIELIKQTAMFMAASNLDEDIANMSYEDVYKTYYNETFNTNNK